jgi:beta-lactamase superfamily II metal-dependent hydrolase
MNDDSPRKSKRQTKLTTYLFNVGQGDNILLKLPNGEFGIIDCFYDSDLDVPEPPALTYLKEVRRRRDPSIPLTISFICLSHPDGDHVKGVSELLSWIEKNDNVILRDLWLWPGTILADLIKCYREFGDAEVKNDTTSRASEVSRELRSIFKFRDRRRNPVNIEWLHDIRKLAEDVGGNVKAVAVAPLGKHVNKFDKQARRAFVQFAMDQLKHTTNRHKHVKIEQNLLSSILMLIYGRHRLLFGGDAGKEVWKDCINHYDARDHKKDHGELEGDFVKASHHGSKNSSEEDVWSKILMSGAKVGISAGRKYSEKHPHRETLAHILKTGEGKDKGPQIFATNSCRNCIDEDDQCIKKRLKWVVRRPDLKDSVRATFSPNLLETLKTGDVPTSPVPPEYLAAYVFRFKPEADIRVFRLFSSAVKGDEDCPFKKPIQKLFPRCAVPEAP